MLHHTPRSVCVTCWVQIDCEEMYAACVYVCEVGVGVCKRKHLTH